MEAKGSGGREGLIEAGLSTLRRWTAACRACRAALMLCSIDRAGEPLNLPLHQFQPLKCKLDDSPEASPPLLTPPRRRQAGLRRH